MNVTGIIAEYNPFHSGHRYQISEARKRGADYIIAAISGDFVQRGEPAVFDKHTRAHMALAAGADLVLELPVCFATASAEDFAACGVALFSRLGAVDTLCFGSECGDLTLLKTLAKVLAEEPEPFSKILREKLKTGAAFPQARTAALASYMENMTSTAPAGMSEGERTILSCVSADALPEVLTGPNNILALEYLKAIRRQNSPLIPLAITRKGAAYHNPELPDGQVPASACALRTEIRKRYENERLYPHTESDGFMVCESNRHTVRRPGSVICPVEGDRGDFNSGGTACKNGAHSKHLDNSKLSGMPSSQEMNGRTDPEGAGTETFARYIPAAAFDALMEECALTAPVFTDDFSLPLSCRLLRADNTGEDLTEFLDVSAELANRLKRNVLSAGSVTDMVQKLKTRQYTATRISRALLHILLNIRTDDAVSRRETGYVSYARILGFRRSAGPLLHRIKKTSWLPLVTKVPDALSTLPAPACAVLRQDLYASHLYRLVLAGKGRSIRDEYSRSPVILP